MKKIKHFLSITDFSAKEIWHILSMAKNLKYQNGGILKGKNAVLLFEKPSLRTKLSFDLAIHQLGGRSIYFGPNEVGLGTREATPDVSKVISSMADLVIARVFSHTQLTEFAQSSNIPVINALSDLEHPCQALADFLTILEIKGKLKGIKLVFVGDSQNNVATSLSLGSKLLGINFTALSPFNDSDPKIVLKDADVIYTDTWVSMGEEAEKSQKLKLFSPYQINQTLMTLAKPNAIFMHCLPAHRGEEVTQEVIDGPQSMVFKQATNRLHAQKALLIYLMKNPKLC